MLSLWFGRSNEIVFQEAVEKLAICTALNKNFGKIRIETLTKGGPSLNSSVGMNCY